MAATILYILICLSAPYLLSRLKTNKYLSPVVLCYIAGILLSFIPLFKLQQEFKENFMGLSVLLAIPMVLISTNMNEWIKLAKEFSKAFAFTVLSMSFSVFACSLIFMHKENIHYLSGMLAGAFIGSATNMNAVGIALKTPTAMFLLANIADIVSTGIFLLIITTFLYPLMNLFLKKYHFPKHEDTEQKNEKSSIGDYVKTFLWALIINAFIIGMSFLFFKKLEQLFVIILLSIVSILASRVPNKPSSEASFNFGYYLLLMFCVIIGSQVDVSVINLQNLWIVGFGCLILFVAVSINILLAYLFKIHSELVIISLAASVYSVPFIGQIALSINKKEIITPGIICSLVGYALGNFIGIGLALAVKWVTGA